MNDLHPKTHLRAAAWVPNGPAQPWDDAIDLAAEWIWAQSKLEGAAPLLVTNALKSGTITDVLHEIATTGGHAAPLGKQRFERGPVLAFSPTEKTLDFAIDLARGSSLVVLESAGFALSEWAAGAGATNLLDGTTTSSGIPEDVRKDLDSTIFFGGNNGWTGSHEKQNARTHLNTHVRSGRLDPDDAAAYVMSQGVSDRGARRLREILAR